ncbi:MAG: BREX system P-loop protein BrxC [Planctomycetota bacterium]|nr:BREX system P-loop protein BrxC [Planctomycetota bacterium]
MLIRQLFAADVTRDIPPVVYFHEQNPAKLSDEVSEYIITGGWPENHPNHRRVPDGIHEQYVRLLKGILAELAKAGGTDLPCVWISGFYGSGKSIFAKLLGLALDGIALPDGRSLAEAMLKRDMAPLASEFRDAWAALRQKIDPLAVVFDIGGVARENEQIHSAAVRQVQRRLGYCSTDPLVADFELKLERDSEWERFQETSRQVLSRPWDEVKDKALAEEDFSLVLSVMYPERYTDPMSWYTSRAGSHQRSESPEEAVAAIRDMLRFRRVGATLFMVVDEVSQYVLSNKDRVDRLRAFATELGTRLKGKVWLLALGQQKLDEAADDSFLIWAKDRFPPKLRVHLAPTNIRDVVHRRLLQKRPEVEADLRTLFEKHRADLKLFAYQCEEVTAEEFVEVYPMLPGHIDLILQITSALRTRSARAQGDDQAIRGLLQLLGELFRNQKLADQPVGALVTLDQIYEVQHTALDSDVQASMARVLNECADDASGLLTRCAKVVALLELIQETVPTDAKLVSQCLYDRLDRGSQVSDVIEALEVLRRRNLLGYSEKQGYKIQSSAGEEWERERRDIGVARETIGEIVQGALKLLLASPERPKLQSRPFPWAGVFSDGRGFDNTVLADPRDEAAVRVDFRFLTSAERTDSTWVKRSDETALRDRLLWVCGDTENVDHLVRELSKSSGMLKKYDPRRDSLSPSRKLLLQEEKNRAEDLEVKVGEAVAAAWMAGRIYFRGRGLAAKEYGVTFAPALLAAATKILPDLFPHFVGTAIEPSELLQLLEPELSGPSTKFLGDALGILELDSGRYVSSCSGVVPRRVQEHIEAEDGVGGSTLLAHFGGPPYGYAASTVKACVAGLLRAGKLRVKLEDGTEITAVRDAGIREVFEKDRPFRRVDLFPAGKDDIGPQVRARICKFFEQRLHLRLDREDHLIADAVASQFPLQAQRLRDVVTRLDRLPGRPEAPAELTKLSDAFEQCVRGCRQTKPTVKMVKKHLDTLNDGVQMLNIFDADLTAEAFQAVRAAADVRDYHAAQLREVNALTANADSAVQRIEKHLATERPWRDIVALEPDLATVRQAYVAERTRLLQWQEQQAEQSRARVKARSGFSTLSGDKAHQVLRPLAQVTTATTAEAVAPALSALRDPFQIALGRAEEEANDRLDQLLSEDENPLIVKIDLSLRNREVSNEAELDALLDEIRKRLLKQIESGARIRLV